MRYEKLLEDIKDIKLRLCIEHLCEEWDIDTEYQKPASSTNKYHPDISNYTDGGLYNHVSLAIEAAKCLYRYWEQADLDIVIAALILHDAWKYKLSDGTHTVHTTRDHAFTAGNKIIYMADSNLLFLGHGLADKLRSVGIRVRRHMSKWSHNEAEVNDAYWKATREDELVQLSDLLSSCKNVFELYNELRKDVVDSE